MRRLFCAALMACAPHVVFATPLGDTVQEVVEDHILPRVQRLDETSQTLSQAAVSDCDVQSQVLRADLDHLNGMTGPLHWHFGLTAGALLQKR